MYAYLTDIYYKMSDKELLDSVDFLINMDNVNPYDTKVTENSHEITLNKNTICNHKPIVDSYQTAILVDNDKKILAQRVLSYDVLWVSKEKGMRVKFNNWISIDDWIQIQSSGEPLDCLIDLCDYGGDLDNEQELRDYLSTLLVDEIANYMPRSFNYKIIDEEEAKEIQEELRREEIASIDDLFKDLAYGDDGYPDEDYPDDYEDEDE